MGPIGCTEISVTDYHSALNNIPEQRRPRLYRGRSLNSRMLYIVFGRAHFCELLGFTKREGFLDWLRPCQLLKTPFSCIKLVLLAIFLIRLPSLLSCSFTESSNFVSRRAQDPDFSATRVCCVHNAPTHAREMQWCQESGRSSHVKTNVWHRAHTLDKHYRGAFKQCCQRLSMPYF